MISEGCILSGASIRESVVGIRAIVKAGRVIGQSVIMGANDYEWASPDASTPPLGIGRNCVIRRAIIDLDTGISDGAKLINADGVEAEDHNDYSIREGIIVVPRGGTITAGVPLLPTSSLKTVSSVSITACRAARYSPSSRSSSSKRS